MELLSWLNTGALLLPIVAFIALHVDAMGRRRALGAARVVRAAAASSPPGDELEEGWSLERTAVLPPRPLAGLPSPEGKRRMRFALDCEPAQRPSADDARGRRDAAPPPAPKSPAVKVIDRLVLVVRRRVHRRGTPRARAR